MRNWVLLLAGFSEASTGLLLLSAPSWFGWLLLGQDLTGNAVPVARVLGIALFALGVSCWASRTAHCGMLIYSVLTTSYLAWLGFRGQWVGPLLWPAVIGHAIITVLLAWASFGVPRSIVSRNLCH